MTTAPWEHSLGHSLRELRQKNGYTLITLSKMTGLSPSFLSQLERGLTNASLNSLVALATTLGTSAPALLSAAQPSAESTVSFTPADEAPEVLDRAGKGYVLVSGHRAIQPLLLVGGPREFEGDHVVHASDEFIYVMAGRIQFELVDEGTYDLGPGDSLCYGAGVRHRWRQLGAKTCRFLAVLAEA